MDETIDELVIDVRAATGGFASDLAQMRGTLNTTLIDGFERAGAVLERGLAKAIRAGSFGFQDLKQVALQALSEIASHALQMGLDEMLGTGGQQQVGTSAGSGFNLLSLFTSLAGSPGRATGGPVSPGRSYLVGERGPEYFVPTAAGRVERMDGPMARGRDVRVSIQMAAPRGTSAPTAMKRSSRQIASAVRNALAQA